MITKLTKEQLDYMYNEHKEFKMDCCNEEDYTKFQFLCSEVFELCPYDSYIEDKWGREIYRVMMHIKKGSCFSYWKVDDTHYNYYLIICQLLDSKHWINWGTSIRNCWFDFSEESDKLVFVITCVSLEDPHYDKGGIEWNEENLNTLLEWLGE